MGTFTIVQVFPGKFPKHFNVYLYSLAMLSFSYSHGKVIVISLFLQICDSKKRLWTTPVNGVSFNLHFCFDHFPRPRDRIHKQKKENGTICP